jgi:hypothetical protein
MSFFCHPGCASYHVSGAEIHDCWFRNKKEFFTMLVAALTLAALSALAFVYLPPAP